MPNYNIYDERAVLKEITEGMKSNLLRSGECAGEDLYWVMVRLMTEIERQQSFYSAESEEGKILACISTMLEAINNSHSDDHMDDVKQSIGEFDKQKVTYIESLPSGFQKGLIMFNTLFTSSANSEGPSVEDLVKITQDFMRRYIPMITKTKPLALDNEYSVLYESSAVEKINMRGMIEDSFYNLRRPYVPQTQKPHTNT